MTKFFVANWKMSMSLEGSRSFLKDLVFSPKDARVIVCPSFPLLPFFKDQSNFSLGAQDCSAHEEGAYTGEVSASLLKDMGCQYVILGHSERRMHHEETSKEVRTKAEQALSKGLVPIVCVGEDLKTYERGETQTFLKKQVEESLPQGECLIAYEPMWAIGTGKIPTLEEIEEAHGFLQQYGMPVLYGGSVKPDNAEGILALPSVSGVLVGGASLCAKSFSKIIGSYS